MRIVAFATVIGLALSAGAQVPQQFNYQGKLIDGTNLVNASTTMVFRLFNIASGGSAFYVETQTVAIVDGLYSTRVGQSPNFGSLTNAATNQSLFLELQIGGTILTPREQVVSVMYALKASGVSTGAITTAMLANNAVTGPKIAFGAISNAHLAAGSVQSNKIDWAQMPAGLQDGDDSSTLLSYDENGTFSSAPQASGTDSIAQGSGNRASGNYSVVGGGQNNTNLAIYGMIGGGASNQISSGAQYATIVGGKGNLATGLYSTVAGGLRNKAAASYSTVSGGGDNYAGGVSAVVGGGDYNTNLAYRATIGGGLYNVIQAGAETATIAGGQYNTASTNASNATIGGGYSNSILANAEDATISGGFSNTIGDDADKATISGGMSNSVQSNATYAMIPGGRDNVAAGYSAFAAGRLAVAEHNGSFVWGDSYPLITTTSSSSDEVTFRCGGGIRFLEGLPNGRRVTWLPGDMAWNFACDRNLKENFEEINRAELLEHINEVPVTRWNFIGETNRTHIGPMAQDVFNILSIGRDPTLIDSGDLQGVSLAAIQGLYQENKILKAQLVETENRLKAIEYQLQEVISGIYQKVVKPSTAPKTDVPLLRSPAKLWQEP